MSAGNAKPRTVVDTNVFVSGMFFPRGKPFALLNAWEREAFRLIITDEQYAELYDVFRRSSLVDRYTLADEIVRTFFHRLNAADRVQPSAAVPIPVRDPKDVPILAAAIGGNADYVVTGDKELLVLRDDPRLGRIAIVTIADFLHVLDTITQPGYQG
ncbi:MAG: putative toxin-antitoxin system toxin component, PIN family [Chloroflexia bacterium]|nr:putative toxin-antitoxin system toxin component, PIN family [Chloroflexia bacterium]